MKRQPDQGLLEQAAVRLPPCGKRMGLGEGWPLGLPFQSCFPSTDRDSAWARVPAARLRPPPHKRGGVHEEGREQLQGPYGEAPARHMESVRRVVAGGNGAPGNGRLGFSNWSPPKAGS